MTNARPALLVLADGTVFRGRAFGAAAEKVGEVVFNTAMSGYQEIATDPSYAGQIVCMTYPHIGNYGVNEEDGEAEKPWIEGMVVRELSPVASNFRSRRDLGEWFEANGIPGIEGVDTRRLTRVLRVKGCVNGVLSTVSTDEAALKRKALAAPDMSGLDLVQGVTCAQPYAWNEGWPERWFTAPGAGPKGGAPGTTYRVVAIDCGVKRNILRSLVSHGLLPTVVPAGTSAEEILSYEPDGVFLSNGPGDPAAVTATIASVRGLLGKVPVFGICLGHQIMALAAGGMTYKLKFGHRGANHPILDRTTGKIEITSQNHGFAVDEASLAKSGFQGTHTNLNDYTNAGIASRDLRAFAVQYHPEAAPGPHDAHHLFQRFRDLIAGVPLAKAAPAPTAPVPAGTRS
jgi:carbamoyl-phosphate synthase small subunit